MAQELKYLDKRQSNIFIMINQIDSIGDKLSNNKQVVG